MVCYSLGVNERFEEYSVGINKTVETFANVNAGNSRRLYLLGVDCQWADGNSTSAHLYLIRCGYSGNNGSIKLIAEDNKNSNCYATIGISGNGRVTITTVSCGATAVFLRL